VTHSALETSGAKDVYAKHEDAPWLRLGARAMKLHGYFRSAASWRVRIALNLKGVKVVHVPHHLRTSYYPALGAMKPL
jgi:Glutathione S-transferase, N-terminal domain